MSLNLNKLEKVRKLENGIVQARCPACAEGGADRKGEHLRILADGRFGCCVHPKDGAHRKRIFALVGEKSLGTFTLRVKVASATPVAQSVKAALTTFTAGTLGTGKSESENGVRGVRTVPTDDSRTPRTGIAELRARTRGEVSPPNIDVLVKLEDLGSGVRGVRTPCGGPPLQTATMPPVVAGERLPYLTAGGTLVIPFDSPERYHWWKPDGERLTVAETLKEVRAARATKERMKHAVTI